MGSWKDNLRTIEPYVPGEQPDFPDMIKLNTNENPYPPSPCVCEILKNYNEKMLRLYPDPNAALLTEAIASYNKLKPEQVFVGVGSDDVLAIAFMTFFNAKQPIVFADITYSFYDVWAKLFQIPYRQIPLDDNFRIRPADYYCENGGVVIANPNAPTGLRQSLEELEDIVRHNPEVVVIIDEAYVDFSDGTARELIHKYDNVLIVQTYSKSRSLAGMRLGHAMGNAELIAAMNAVRCSFNSYPLTRLSIEIGAAAIQDTAYFEKTRQKVIAVREWTKRELKKLGFSFPDSQTNFIFARHDTVPAAFLFEQLRQKHIFVRHFPKGRIDNYLRISIGTEEEMRVFLKEIGCLIADYNHCCFG